MGNMGSGGVSVTPASQGQDPESQEEAFAICAPRKMRRMRKTCQGSEIEKCDEGARFSWMLCMFPPEIVVLRRGKEDKGISSYI